MLGHSQTCPSKNAPARSRGIGFGVNSSPPPLGKLCCSLKSDHAGGGRGEGNGDTLLSHSQRGDRASAAVQVALTDKQSLLLCPRLPSDPCPQPVCRQPASTTALLCFLW